MAQTKPLSDVKAVVLGGLLGTAFLFGCTDFKEVLYKNSEKGKAHTAISHQIAERCTRVKAASLENEFQYYQVRTLRNHLDSKIMNCADVADLVKFAHAHEDVFTSLGSDLDFNKHSFARTSGLPNKSPDATAVLDM